MCEEARCPNVLPSDQHRGPLEKLRSVDGEDESRVLEPLGMMEFGAIRQGQGVERHLTKLTPEEKLELIDELWTSMTPEEFPLRDEQRAELHRRLDRLDEDGPTGVSWDSVRAEMTPRS